MSRTKEELQQLYDNSRDGDVLELNSADEIAMIREIDVESGVSRPNTAFGARPVPRREVSAAEFGANETYDVVARANVLMAAVKPIPVTERLPEEVVGLASSHDVLLYVPDCGDGCGGQWFRGFLEFCEHGVEGFRFDTKYPRIVNFKTNVTHWLPMPPLPEVKPTAILCRHELADASKKLAGWEESP